MTKTLGVRGSADFLSWSTKNGWRPLLFRHCTHPAHQHRKHWWSRMNGYRLFQKDYGLTGSQLRESVQREQICEGDLVIAWRNAKAGLDIATGGMFKAP